MMDRGEVQNFVGIHPTQEAADATQSSSSAEVKDSMVQEFITSTQTKSEFFGLLYPLRAPRALLTEVQLSSRSQTVAALYS